MVAGVLELLQPFNDECHLVVAQFDAHLFRFQRNGRASGHLREHEPRHVANGLRVDVRVRAGGTGDRARVDTSLMGESGQADKGLVRVRRHVDDFRNVACHRSDQSQTLATYRLDA